MQNRLHHFSIRIVLFMLLVMAIGFNWSQTANGQAKKSSQKPNPAARPVDSATRARQEAMAQMREAQKKSLDSAKAVRQHFTDSMKASRQRLTDSMTAIRKYRESKKYQDSIVKSRQAKLDVVKAAQKAKTDSMKAARQQVTDSLFAIRKKSTDSLRSIQKQRTDSIATIRKYKESKRYTDSVSIVRQLHTDSLRKSRKAFSDSSIASRKQIADSMKAVRKLASDSVLADRKKFTDSMKIVRKAKTDSLAKIKESRAKLQKVKDKQKEDKMKLALEIKIKKRHEAWNNEKMLKKKWSVPRQVVQNTFTHYNYYFNANKKMDEALLNMQRAKKEPFDSLIALFPFDPDRDSTMLSADMDSIIHKASVAIQIHDPRIKWGDDMYLLMGQAYYYKGDYENAITAFRYTISLKDQFKKKNTSKPAVRKREQPSIAEEDKNSILDFLKHQSVHNEALLWLARVYTQSGRNGESESVLDLLTSDSKFPEDLKGQLAVEKAFLLLKEKNYKSASDELTVVTADTKIEHWLRMRAAYLNGQIMQNQGNNNGAAENFRKVIDMKPKIDMDFYARRNLAYSIMEAGGDQQEGIAALKRMLNDGKYSPYYEQVYYILGRMSANNKQTDDAIAYLQKSLHTPKSTKKQKAVSFAVLGNVFYQTGRYQEAKVAYDSASYFAKYAPDDKDLAIAVRRSRALDEVTTPLTIIHTQDSLLKLASLSTKDQQSAVRRYIRHLEQLREDSIFRAENAGMNAAAQNEEAGSNNNIANWYFTNQSQMQQGLNDFKRKWGNRQLADNWRISSGGGMAMNNMANNAPSGQQNSNDDMSLDEKGLPTEASLLAMIPNTPDRQQDARRRVQRAYIDLANAYVRQLDELGQALKTLDTLDARYPSHEHKAQDYYLRYLVALKQNQLAQAQQYSNKLTQEYPDSKYAALVRPTEDKGDNQAAGSKANVAVYYDETYAMLSNHQYNDVLSRVKTARAQYTDAKYLNRFAILEASAMAANGSYSTADSMINEYLKSNPADSLRSWAEAIQQYIVKNKPATPPPSANIAQTPAQPANGNNQQPVMNPQANNKPAEGANKPAETVQKTTPAMPPAKYSYKPNEEHYFVFSYNAAGNKAFGVKAGMADLNTLKFSGQGLSTTLEPIKDQAGLVITRSFQNASRAKIYMNVFNSSPGLVREFYSSEYQVFIISASNLLKLQADHSVQEYLNFYKQNYK